MRRRGLVIAIAVVAILLGAPLAASAEDLEPFVERSAQADFTGQQVVSCDTPDGTRSVVIDLVQADGVTVARNAVGGDTRVRVAGGSFSVVTDDGISGTSASLSQPAPVGSYRVTRVENATMLGRQAQRLIVSDADGLTRATMTFDLETGALLAARIRNADGSVYCAVRMVEFDDQAPNVADDLPAEAQRRMETVGAPDDARLPEDLAGFSRLETYAWDRGGVLAYYSDGLFSFALLATDRAVVLDDSGARAVQVDGGEYVRWFGAGQAIYVWETADGGLAMYGDLPLDLQDQVLDALPEPARFGILARWWRNLFG